MKEWIDNDIGNEGAKALRESLKINTSLTSVNLGGDEKIRNENERIEWKRNDKWIVNQIGDEGAKSVSESLKINTSLTELYLSGDEKIRNEKRQRIEWKEMINE